MQAVAESVVPCGRQTVVGEADLGGRIAALLIVERGVIGVLYDPAVVRGQQLGWLRLWWRHEAWLGHRCRIFWTRDLPAMGD